MCIRDRPGLIGKESKAKGGWRDYKSQFKLDGWEVFSCGLLEAALDYVNRDGDIDVVIIDEAHRFKNQDTQDYETLCNICRGRQVIMLTATPFNNRPADIFSLLKLFIVPNRSKITLDNHLANRFAHYDRLFRLLGDIHKHHQSTDPRKFKKAEQAFLQLWKHLNGVAADKDKPIDLRLVKGWSQTLAREIRHILEPVIIRRNRIDLRNDPDYRDEVTELSDMMPPVEQFYELSPEQSKFYDEILNEYFGEDGRFKGAIYRPFIYEQSLSGELDAESNRELNQQTNLYDFMRRLLVRRFESSFGAFAQSIKNFLAIHQKAATFISRTEKFILDRKLLEKIYEADDDLIEDELNRYEEMLETKVLPKNNKIYEIKSFVRRDDFIADIEADIQLFKELIERMEILTLATNDPKAACLARTLISVISGTHKSVIAKSEEPARKVIVFSEYADTIHHLSDYLSEKIPGEIITAVGSISAKIVLRIESNFDALFKEEQKDDYQILLTTDKMSEGHNLNRAGLVINYDIPWNPTRAIQRVGRINRIGKKVFQELYIFNFFPTDVGATIAKSREIAATKMFMIHNSIGEDTQIFDIDEVPTASSLYQKLQQSPEAAETESFLTFVKKELAELKQTHPETFDRISKLPFRIKTAKAASANELILFKRKGLGLFCLQVDEGENMKIAQIPVEDALKKLRCSFEEPRLELGDSFWKAYDLAGKYQRMFSGGGRNALSIETKARNNLIAAIKFCEKEHHYDILPFLRTLLEDIRQYGSLPDYTLRKLGQHDFHQNSGAHAKFFDAVSALRETLGDHYLFNLKTRLNYKNSDIIIAAELQEKI